MYSSVGRNPGLSAKKKKLNGNVQPIRSSIRPGVHGTSSSAFFCSGIGWLGRPLPISDPSQPQLLEGSREKGLLSGAGVEENSSFTAS